MFICQRGGNTCSKVRQGWANHFSSKVTAFRLPILIGLMEIIIGSLPRLAYKPLVKSGWLKNVHNSCKDVKESWFHARVVPVHGGFFSLSSSVSLRLGSAGNNSVNVPCRTCTTTMCLRRSRRQVVPWSLAILEVWGQRDPFSLLICPTWDHLSGAHGIGYLHTNDFDWQHWDIAGYTRRWVTPTERREGDDTTNVSNNKTDW